MGWEKIAELFDIEPGVIREAAAKEEARLKKTPKPKKVYPEDVLIYEICETYPEWSRIRKLVPLICTFSKDEFAFVSLLGRSPLARMLLFKMRADCDDKAAALTLEEFLYGNPLLPPGVGTDIQRTGFIRYWLETEGEEGTVDRLKIIGYSEEEAKEIINRVKKEAGVVIPPKPVSVEEEKKPPTKEDVLADIKKRMEKYK